MKIAFISVLTIFSIFFVIFIAKFKNKTDTHRSMFEAFISALLVMLSNICIVVSKNEWFSYISYMVFFVSLDFLLLFFMVFCNRYVTKKTSRWMYAFLGLCILDGIQMFVNLFTHHCYWVIHTTYHGEPFLLYSYNWIYVAHLILCYVEIVIGFAYIVKGIFDVPSIYRIKYYFLLAAFLLCMAFDGVYLIFKNPIDWAVTSFALVAIGSYYFILIFAPVQLKRSALLFVTDTMEQGLILFDIENENIYENTFFQEYFQFSEGEKEILLNQWRSDIPELQDSDCTRDYELEKNGNKKYYRLQYHRFLSRKKQFLGSFFMVTDMTKERELLEIEHHRATHDDLTGIYSRDYFFERVEERFRNNPNKKYAMICSDIGNFKFINEMFGTSAADSILMQFADVLKRLCAKDIYGRIGKDNFALLCEQDEYSEEIFLQVTREIMGRLDEQIGLFFTCYIGVYFIDENVFARTMTDRAMLALKQIKGTTKRVAYYTKDMSDAVLLDQELSGLLTNAIKNKEIQMYLQPQVDASGRILGAEALVRWIHPEKGILSPGIFTPIFEKNGRITELDLYMWEEAAKKIKEWEGLGYDYHISVNISPKDLVVLDIENTFATLIDKYHIEPRHLKLEITESAVMQSVKETEDLIHRLHQRGFIVEMDDFGSGYSSLNMLKSISVDTIKLDMEFLRNAEYPDRSKKIIESIVQLAEKLNLEIITEGVETKEHLDFLTSIGCEVFQGYYFAKPMPVESFEEKIGK